MIGKSWGFTSGRLSATTHRVHPKVVGNGARRLRRFNLSTPLRSENFSVFPILTPKRAEARAPNEHQQLGDARPPIAAKVNEQDSIFCLRVWSVCLTASSETTKEI